MCPAGVVVVVTSLLGTASVIKPLLLPAFCPTFTRPGPLVPGGSGRRGREGGREREGWLFDIGYQAYCGSQHYYMYITVA